MVTILPLCVHFTDKQSPAPVGHAKVNECNGDVTPTNPSQGSLTDLLSLSYTRPDHSFRVTSPPHVNALDALIVVVNPNVRPGPNWTAMERDIMKTRSVVEHVV